MDKEVAKALDKIAIKKPAKKEDKFIVVKKADFEALVEANLYYRYSSMPPAIRDQELQRDIEGFSSVLHKLDKGNRYITCNQDEPYAEVVWQTILNGETAKKQGSPKKEKE